MDKDKILEKIRESIEDAIKPILKKGESMTPADLENLTKAVCIIEKIKRIEDCEIYDDSGYSETGSYRHSMKSMARDRMNRDVMPAYHDERYYDNGNSARSHNSGNSGRYYEGNSNSHRYYDGGSGNSGYSGHSIQDRMIDQLERMIDEAKTEHERQTVKDWIRRLRG